MASKGINFAVAELENTLAQVINISGLPVCVVRLIFQRCLNELVEIEKNQATVEQSEYQDALAAELAQPQKQEDVPIVVQKPTAPTE